MEQGRNKKLINDILIYGAGNFGSRLITFLIFPVYTFFIEPDSMGYYDLSLVTIIFLMPFINLQLRDGVFRFLIDNKDDKGKKDIITQSYRLIFIMVLIATVIFTILSFFVEIRCGAYIFAFLLAFAFYEVQVQIVRGLGLTKFYVLCGLITAISILLLSLLFIVILKMNIEGIFLSNILARVITLTVIEIKYSLLQKYFSFRTKFDDVARSLLKFCLPLILVTTFFWIIGNSLRYFISYEIGLYAFGIFATAMKFTSIIEQIAGTVFLAWQETSIFQYHSEDRDRYYSSVMDAYLLVLTGIVIVFSFFMKSFYTYLVDTKYASGSIYVYVLCIALIGYSLQSFISALFQVEKKTVKMFQIAFVTAMVSLLFNFLFIRYFGLMGAAVSYGLSFLFMFTYYLISANKSIKIVFSTRTLVVSLVLLIGGGVIFYGTNNVLWIISFCILSLYILYLLLPKPILQEVGNLIKKKTQNHRPE